MTQRIDLVVTLEHRPEDKVCPWGAEVSNGFTNGRAGGTCPIAAISLALDGLESSILRLDDDLRRRVLSWHPH